MWCDYCPVLVLTSVILNGAHASIGVRLTQQWFIGAGPLNLKNNLLWLILHLGAGPVAATFSIRFVCPLTEHQTVFDL